MGLTRFRTTLVPEMPDFMAVRRFLQRMIDDLALAINRGGELGLEWQVIEKDYSDLATAGLTNDIEVYSLAAKEVMHGVVLKHSASFSGGAISAYTLSVGVTGSLEKYCQAFDVYQAPSNTAFEQTSVLWGGRQLYMENYGASTSVRLAATSVGANLDQATAGVVEVCLLTSLIPT